MSFHSVFSTKRGISGKVLSIIISLVIGLSIVIIYFAFFGPEKVVGLVNKTFFNMSLPTF